MTGNERLRAGESIGRHQAEPRAAKWVYNSETDRWRFWIVPSKEIASTAEFYRLWSDAISKNRSDLGGLDISDVEFQNDAYPAVMGMTKLCASKD